MLLQRITILFIFLNISTVFAQEDYQFSADILAQIDKDTVSWKYQTGATALSFSGYYKEVLNIWDKNGVRKPKITADDSLYFANSKKINAKDYIIKQSKNKQVIIVNEAHHVASHRTFTTSLLKELYKNGYRYLGLEALQDASVNQQKYAVTETGYYTKEPEFGNLVYEALKIGYTLFHYEAADGKNNKEREIEQAQNIQNFMKSVPNGKFIIHCGYAHAYENDYPAWGKAMAGRLKESMNIDPFTIDQTQFLERFDTANNHLFTNLNTTGAPIVLVDKNGVVFNGKTDPKQTDVVVIHPPTKYINNRADWFIKGKTKYSVPASKSNNNKPLLVLAYRNTEFENKGTPADVIEITNNNAAKDLYLAKGKYTIVIKDKNYQIIDQYQVKIK